MERSKRLFVLTLSALMVFQSLITMPSTIYAGKRNVEKINCVVGIPNLFVELSFADKKETGRTADNGDFAATKLYEYLDSLGWNAEDTVVDGETVPAPEPEKTEVKVNYSINYPDAATPEDRKEAGGQIEYKGIKDSFTLKYDKDGDWKKSIKLNAPEKEKKITGILKLIPFGKDKDDAKSISGVKVTLTAGNVKKTCTTNESGEYIFYGYSKENEDVKLSVATSNKYPALSVNANSIKESLYLHGRPTVTSSDFEIVGAFNGYVSKPSDDTEYTIKAKKDNKITLTRDGEASDEVKVTLTPDGHTTRFFIEKNGICSDAVEDAIKIDETAPELIDIDTKAVNEVKIKKHGIYTKQKAELLITVTVKEAESGLNKIHLVGKNSEETTYYDTTSIKTENGLTKATFYIESQKELLTQVLYLTSSDNVGNKSKDVLLRGSEDPSRITMEIIPPIVDDIKVTKGTINENGWYKEALDFSVDTTDAESGLSDVDVTTNNSVSLYSKSYEEKETGKQTAIFSLSEKNIENEKNGKGEYKILAKVVDNSGNITAKSITVNVDLVAPVLSLTGVEKGAYLQKGPTLEITEDEEYYDAKGNHFTVTVKRDGKESYQKTFNQVNKGTIPSSVFSIDGKYNVTVTCADAAGNEAKSVSTSFVKDNTAPIVDIAGPNGGKFYNKAQTSVITVKERNYDTNKVHISATRTLGNKTVKVNIPWKNTSFVSKASKTLSETGTYKISVYAIDKAGNRSKTQTVNFTVDTVPPELTINGVTEGKTYSYNDVIAPSVSFHDDYLEGRTITVTRAGRDWYSRLAKSEGTGSIKFADFQKIKNNDGLYTMSVTVSDKAGNSTKKTVSFTVNRFGSSFKYNKAVNDLKSKAVKNVTEDLVITEYNVSKLSKTKNQLKHDGNAIKNSAKTENGAPSNGYRSYRHIYPANLFENEGVYEVNVISADTAGNTMESKKENGQVKFTVDRTKPTLKVSGYEKYNKADSITLDIKTTDNLSDPKISVAVNEQIAEVNGTQGHYTVKINKGSNQKVQIIAEDNAENSTSFEETISVIPNGFIYFLMKYKLIIGGVVVLGLIAAAFIIIKKKKISE